MQDTLVTVLYGRVKASGKWSLAWKTPDDDDVDSADSPAEESRAAPNRELGDCWQHERDEIIAPLIQRSGGVPLACGRDEFLIAFRWTVTHKDAEIRAVRTAMELYRLLVQSDFHLDDGSRTNVTAAFGVYTSVTSAENLAEASSFDRETHISDVAISVAVYLSSVARTPGVFVVQATSRRILGSFRCRSVGRHFLPDVPNEQVEVCYVLPHSKAAATAAGLPESAAAMTDAIPPVWADALDFSAQEPPQRLGMARRFAQRFTTLPFAALSRLRVWWFGRRPATKLLMALAIIAVSVSVGCIFGLYCASRRPTDSQASDAIPVYEPLRTVDPGERPSNSP